MNRHLLMILVLMVMNQVIYAQKERSMNRKGIKDFEKAQFSDAEVNFMKALEIDSTSLEAGYNLASSLYKQDKFKEAAEILSGLSENKENMDELADIYHNLGNNMLKQEMYPQSIEAYKNALKLRPDDEDTRYNLAYAQAKLKNQEQQDQKNNQDKDNKKDQENKDKEDQENKDKEDQKQDQQQQDQQQQNQDQQQQDQQQQQVPLSKEDMERMLRAISQQEKQVKEKLEKQKAAAKKIKTEKDW